jgi:ATP-dependent DNA ligase
MSPPRPGVEGVVIKGAETPYRPGQPDWAKYRIYITTLAIIAGVTGTLAEPTALLLGQFDQAGRLRYVARSHQIGTAAQRVLAASQLRAATSHPWPQPMPAGWVGSFNQGRALVYTAVEPETVAEIEVDAAVEYHRWRHGARFVRLRTEMHPMQLPRISADDWSQPSAPPELAE